MHTLCSRKYYLRVIYKEFYKRVDSLDKEFNITFKLGAKGSEEGSIQL